MTCSSHGDRRGDSGLLVGQVCRSGRPSGAKTCWHGDAGLRKVLDSVAAGSAELLSGTGVGFASSCFFTDMLNASNSRGPRSARRVWPHTASTHSHTHTRVGAHAKKHTSRTNTRQSNKCKQTNKQTTTSRNPPMRFNRKPWWFFFATHNRVSFQSCIEMDQMKSK